MNTQLLNNHLGRGKQWLLKREISYANRLSQLQNKLERSVFDRRVLFGSFLPNINKEAGVEKRILKTEFSKYIRSVFNDPNSFADSLKESEELFTKDVVFNGDNRRLIMATAQVIEKCNFPSTKFEPLSILQASQYLKSDTSSGYPYRQKKGKIVNTIIKDCVKYMENPTNNPLFTFPLLSSFRLQLREKMGKIVCATRTIFPYPASITLFELRFIRPFIEHFTNTDTFYCVGRNGEQIRSRLISLFMHDNVKKIASTDFSAYDKTLCNTVIQMAFYVLRSQMRLTKADSDLFDSLVDYFCCSFVNSSIKKKDQHLFLKTHGIASGSGFTNLIGSICHAILVAYYDPALLDRSLICGDDNIMDISHFNFKNYVSALKREFQMEISLSKCKIHTSYHSIHFLGFVWTDFVRMVSPFLTINQCIYHTDFRVDLDTYQREV
ncbi:RNA-dependent RNA polymerase, partial [viral metagenome]